MKFLPFDPDREVTRSRRNLPHWEQSGCTLYVTFRLADSIPKVKLDQWKCERETWLIAHREPWSDDQKKEYQKLFVDRIERWSDAGYGGCHMNRTDVRDIITGALKFFDKERYDLCDYVIMPNHVHVLVTPRPPHTLGAILHSWKSFTSNRINAHLQRTGTLWMDERFDHIVRSREHLEWYRRYILENPKKARLRDGTYTHWQQESKEQGGEES